MNTFPALDKKQTLKVPQQFAPFELFFCLVKHVRLQEVSSLCCSMEPSMFSLTLAGFIKDSGKQLFPAVPSWDMPCGTLPFALPDLNAMWQVVGSKTGPAWCLAQDAMTYTTDRNRILTNGWWKVGKEFNHTDLCLPCDLLIGLPMGQIGWSHGFLSSIQRRVQQILWVTKWIMTNIRLKCCQE